MLKITQVNLVFHPDAWFITLDLENTHWHIPTDLRYQHFLAAQAGKPVRQFTVLLFSLNTAPQVFTVMMKPAE